MASMLENMLLGSKYAALEFFSLDGKEKIAFLEVQKKKSELVISNTEIFAGREVLSRYKSKTPTLLVVNTNNVLQKEIAGVDPNDKKLLHKAFPNLQAEEFYYEIWRKNSVSIVAVCRKIYVDALVDSVKSHFRITGISLGVASLANMAGFGLPPIVSTNSQNVLIEASENIINSAIPENLTYNINGLEIPNTHILGFSALLALILSPNSTGTVQDYNLRLYEDWKQKAFFEKSIMVGLGILLSLLLVNFIAFSYYFDNVTKLTEAIALKKTDIENIAEIKSRIRQKQDQLSGLTGDNKKSAVLINDIVKDLPTTILLNEIAYHPLEKKVKAGEDIVSLERIIKISGNSNNNEDFTAWIERTGKIKRIEKINIVSFGHNSDNKTAFEIQILTLR